MRLAAKSRSDQSAHTTAAPLPPSSSTTCLRGAESMIDQPTGPEPVNDTTGSRGSLTSSTVSSLPTVSTENAPSGSSVSASSSPSSSADSGVRGAGLTMIGAPAAIAGAILCATRFSGKLNGAMPSTGPRATRRTTAIRPSAAGSVSSRCSSPEKRRASSAAKRNVETQRVTSTVAHLSGLPFSAVIISAISSALAATERDTWSSAAARTCAGVERNVRVAASAAATARSTCSALGTQTVAISSRRRGAAR